MTSDKEQTVEEPEVVEASEQSTDETVEEAEGDEVEAEGDEVEVEGDEGEAEAEGDEGEGEGDEGEVEGDEGEAKAETEKKPKGKRKRQTKMKVEEPVSPRLLSIAESLLFAAEKPLKPSQIQKLLGERSPARVRRVLDTLMERREEAGVVVVEVDGGYQLRTNPENARWVRRLEEVKPVRMSRAALEVVAVAAYRQPVTRAEIDVIRGVDSGGALKHLLSRDLVRILGRKDEPGRPFLYGTTHEFLSFFSLGSLSELPPLRDVSELAGAPDEAEEIVGDDDEAEDAEGVAAGGGPQAPVRPEEPPEVTPEEIAASEDELDEFDEGDDEVLEALAAASDAAKGADKVKRTLKKMVKDEAEAGTSNPEATQMLHSIEQLVISRRQRKLQAEAAAAAEAAGEGGEGGAEAPGSGEPQATSEQPTKQPTKPPPKPPSKPIVDPS